MSVHAAAMVARPMLAQQWMPTLSPSRRRLASPADQVAEAGLVGRKAVVGQGVIDKLHSYHPGIDAFICQIEPLHLL